MALEIVGWGAVIGGFIVNPLYVLWRLSHEEKL